MQKIYTPMVALLLSSAQVLLAQPVNMTYTNVGSHTYTVPPNYTATITVRAWGGGGGGGTGTGNNAKGGGGGGAYITNTYVNVPAGDYSIVVGDGGAPGVAGGGSSYTFTNGLVEAGGGGEGGNNGGSRGMVTGASGMGSTDGGKGGGRNDPNGAGGGGGGSGQNAMNGGDAPDNLTGGTGGTNNGGNGGALGQSGVDANGRGGGGGGRGANGATSGSGDKGRVIVEVDAFVLPVELSAIQATLKNQAVELSWQTASELNNAHFIIETSTEGEVFNRIGEIAGAGTTTETHDYQFTHHTPSAGSNYYRLKQVDFDGTFAYSKVLAINAPGSHDIFAFPNPAKDKITLQYDYSKGAGNVQLFDALGRRLNASIGGYAGNYEVKLPEGLAKGTYWLKVERGGKVQTVAVVKE